ncbi:fluoride efflux transporter family protein [Corynebacterium halotolerans]|uniref:fluoride efflux transporter family protein n=1 Tax=Corynebacterium halotolerans TaxID=225326 RepID=UPI003CF4BAFA
MIREALSIGAGAAIGALARFALLLAFGEELWPVLGINLVGSLVMGRLQPGAFVGAGVLGGFTTFSTFAALTARTSPGTAAGYAVATVLGCVLAWMIGDQLRRSALRRRGERP